MGSALTAVTALYALVIDEVSSVAMQTAMGT